jgi:hypothetical protein
VVSSSAPDRVLVCVDCSARDVDDDLAIALGWRDDGSGWHCPDCAGARRSKAPNSHWAWPADPRSGVHSVVRPGGGDPRERPTVPSPRDDE